MSVLDWWDRWFHRNDDADTVQLSIIVPFRAPYFSPRAKHWRWLKAYWAHELPKAEIVVADSPGTVFSKTVAVNNAVARSKGRILAVIDADTYLPGEIVDAAAKRLDRDVADGVRRWIIPYRQLYRLTEQITDAIVSSDPKRPLRLPTPPPDEWVESTAGSMHGRRYGALIVIYPREAFDLIGGMDPRFEGWGGEDIAFARALDTLYAKHKTTDNDVLHLWHPKIGADYKTRVWAGQVSGLQNNGNLANRYSHATGDRQRMRDLVDEAWPPESDI